MKVSNRSENVGKVERLTKSGIRVGAVWVDGVLDISVVALDGDLALAGAADIVVVALVAGRDVAADLAVLVLVLGVGSHFGVRHVC